MDEDTLDKITEQLVKEARQGSEIAKEQLRTQIISLLAQPSDEQRKKQLTETVEYILQKIVNEFYAEKSREQTYEDSHIQLKAKTIPAMRLDGTYFYLAGDAHFFYRINEKEYVLGRMDGMGHGVNAAILVITARQCIEELLAQKKYELSEFATQIAEKLVWISKSIGFTTFFMSIMEDKKLKFINAGDGRTFIYEPKRRTLTKILSKGPPLGMMRLKEMEKKGKMYQSEERTMNERDMIISLTDGIYEREGVEEEIIENIITTSKTPEEVTNTVINYAINSSPSNIADDMTVISVLVK